MNNKKKFDVCLMNPPYGSVGGDTLHLKFVDKILDVADLQVVVMPFSLVTKNTKSFKKYKEKLSKYLVNIEEVSSKIFKDTNMGNVAIYELKNNKNSKNISIQYIDGSTQHIEKLEDSRFFSTYEDNFINILLQNGTNDVTWAGGHRQNKKNLVIKYPSISMVEINQRINDEIIKNCEHLKQYSNKFFITCNNANGGMNGTFISNKNGKILNGYNELCNEMINANVSSGYNILIMNSIKATKNCIVALKNPLLRFTCFKTQEDQSMPFRKCYKYIPNIDWEDDRVLTDEGLLEVCGCPKDKIKEYTEYCRKYIEENVDKKK